MAHTNKEAVSHNMKLIRSLTGLSMNDFGKKLGGVSKDQIASYEAGRALPPTPTALRICDLAGITQEEFLTKSITKEEIVKEMFVVLNNAAEQQTGSNQDVEELRKVIETLKSTIEAQGRIIEMQGRMMEQFSALVNR